MDKDNDVKILQLTAMHGRHSTVSFCIDQMPWMQKLFVASTDEDVEFCQNNPEVNYYVRALNDPLSMKWQAGVNALKNLDFDAIIILGSDDWIDWNTYQYISTMIKEGFDFIGFEDCYFLNNGTQYYWPGYKTIRQGEPIGAGRTISREVLKRMDWKLFPKILNRGLDRISWPQICRHSKRPLITKLKTHGLMMCDIKDPESMNPIHKIKGAIKLN
jgi:hypothetical protein